MDKNESRDVSCTGNCRHGAHHHTLPTSQLPSGAKQEVQTKVRVNEKRKESKVLDGQCETLQQVEREPRCVVDSSLEKGHHQIMDIQPGYR
ncbi:hypothetical protein RUM43_010570 [Polyplax serrata]|uniref:Uncharacterized protein n=1 Tax=Polyplax serrata TaxID=468196 RepID=A0AAN8PKQ7_POLSC